MTRASRPLADRLWARVDRRGPDECWLWVGYRQPAGYGQMAREGQRLDGTHRIAWEVANGRRVPLGLLIRHTCDNPPCCNPAHLLLGTNADNVKDAVDRKRFPVGSKRSHSKLTEEDVAYIRANYRRANGRSNGAELASRFGISTNYIAVLVRGDRWKHVTPEVNGGGQA